MGNCLYDCMTKKRNNQNFEACHIEFFLFAYFCELWMNLLNAKSVLLGVTSLWWFLLDKDDWSHKNKHSLYKILQPSSKSCFHSKTYTTLFLLLFPCICSWKKVFYLQCICITHHSGKRLKQNVHYILISQSKCYYILWSETATVQTIQI